MFAATRSKIIAVTCLYVESNGAYYCIAITKYSQAEYKLLRLLQLLTTFIGAFGGIRPLHLHPSDLYTSV